MTAPEIRRAAERGLLRNDWLEGWCSFSFGPWQQPGRERFGALRVLNEDWMAPDSGFAPHPHDNLEILLMPLQSVTDHADSLGHRLAVQPDELLAMRAGRGIWHSQMNASATERDHHLQLWLLPRRRDAEPGLQHRRFAPAGRQDRWELWASGWGEAGVPAVDADARVHRARLAAGAGLAAPGDAPHSAYLHVATGRIRLWADDQAHELAAGDALAWPRVGALRLQALAPAELLYVEQAPLTP